MALLGYTTASFPDHRLASAIRILQDAGYRSIAIRLDAKCFDPLLANGEFDGQLELVQSELDERTNVIVDTDARHLLCPRRAEEPSLLDVERGDQRCDLIRAALRFSKRLNDALVVFSSGRPVADHSDEQNLEILAERIDTLIELSLEVSGSLAIRPSVFTCCCISSEFRASSSVDRYAQVTRACCRRASDVAQR